MSWWEAAWIPAGTEPPESRILRSVPSAAIDFQSDLGQMQPKHFCLYSANDKASPL